MLLLAAALVACTACDGNTKTTWGPGCKFTGIGSTYCWGPGAEDATGDPKLGSPYLHELITKLVEEQLAAKGYTKKTTGTPDFWVVYRIAKRIRGQADGVDAQYSEGSLIIYTYDPPTGLWIWRTFAEARLHESNPPDIKKARLQEVIRRMFKDFPTQGGQSSGAGRPNK